MLVGGDKKLGIKFHWPNKPNGREILVDLMASLQLFHFIYKYYQGNIYNRTPYAKFAKLFSCIWQLNKYLQVS